MSGAGGAAPPPAVAPLAGRASALLPCAAHGAVRAVCTEGGGSVALWTPTVFVLEMILNLGMTEKWKS